MHCPFCPFEGPPRMLHGHLGEQHPDAVRFEEKGGRSFYALTCPVCGDGYEREIKPRGRDPGFLDEFSAQIRLVPFDMLVNHLIGEHEELDLPPGASPMEVRLALEGKVIEQTELMGTFGTATRRTRGHGQQL